MQAFPFYKHWTSFVAIIFCYYDGWKCFWQKLMKNPKSIKILYIGDSNSIENFFRSHSLRFGWKFALNSSFAQNSHTHQPLSSKFRLFWYFFGILKFGETVNFLKNGPFLGQRTNTQAPTDLETMTTQNVLYWYGIADINV